MHLLDHRIEHPHRIAALKQQFDDVTSNETGAAGYQNSLRHCRSPRLGGRRVAVHKLIEVAFVAAAFFFLIKEGKLAVVEDFEELIPRNLLKTFFGLAEINSENAA